MNRYLYILPILVLVTFYSCKKEIKQTTPYTLVQPNRFPIFENDIEKGITEEGIALGRRLFYDPILSEDGTMACATCHKQEDGFSDKRQFSIGIDGTVGSFQAMPIMNLVWDNRFFWNGRTSSLENQALEPVEDPNEMNAHWPIVIEKIKNIEIYQEMFDDAFPELEITKELAVDAIAQFEKTLISSGSNFDKVKTGEYSFTDQEIRGALVFRSESAECDHCHTGYLFSDLQFHNNGLDAIPDLGREAITNDSFDKGKFKTPSLRNLAYTAPYMHDGRFNTLDEVLEFYRSGVQNTPHTDPLMFHSGGIQLTDMQIEDLKAFLQTLNDPDFITNPEFSSPF